MLTGLLPYLTLFAGYVCRVLSIRRVDRFFFSIAVVLIVLLAAGREFGPDLINYQLYYSNADISNIFTFGLEPGYVGAMVFVKNVLHGDFNVFMFIINTLTLISVYSLARKYSANIQLTFLIYFSFYFFLYECTALRQGLALSFILLSFHSIIRKKPVWFCACVLLAFSCHNSAILFLPAYWVAWHLHVQPKAAVIIVLILTPLVLVDLSPYISRFFVYFSASEKYADLYSSAGEYAERVGLTVGVVLKVLFFALYAFCYNKKSPVEYLLYNLYWFYLLLYMPLSSVAIISSRGLDYYKIFDMITLTYVVKNQNTLLRKAAVSLLLLSYTAYSLWGILVEIEEFPSVLQDMLNVIS